VIWKKWSCKEQTFIFRRRHFLCIIQSEHACSRSSWSLSRA